MSAFKPFVARAATGQPLSSDEAAEAFGVILEGAATPAQIAAFLMALRMRGETADEIGGAVRAMRSRMVTVKAPADAIDIVGTGGDHSGSYNVSTLAAIIVAAAGVPVAKHGNRAASSLTGSADVLTTLGVKLGLSARGIERCIEEAGIGFMMAPSHHPAMRHVGPVRSELGVRTIFNLLGPLCNPAGVRRMLLGVFDPSYMTPMLDVMMDLGADDVMVVHGHGGLDELSTTGQSTAIRSAGGKTHSTFHINGSDAGLPVAEPEALKGGDPQHNAAALQRVLSGAPGAYRDIGVLNAAAALMIGGKAKSLHDGARLAEKQLDTGAAAKTLSRLVAASQKLQ
jgi:anthranilate phosphoribosyltransferase